MNRLLFNVLVNHYRHSGPPLLFITASLVATNSYYRQKNNINSSSCSTSSSSHCRLWSLTDSTSSCATSCLPSLRRVLLANGHGSGAAAGAGAAFRPEWFQPYVSIRINFPESGYRGPTKVLGAGVMFDQSGLVVTTISAIGFYNNFFVMFPDGTEAEGKLVDSDLNHRLAIIKVEQQLDGQQQPIPYPVAQFSHQPPDIGQLVYSLSHPFFYTFSAGRISVEPMVHPRNGGQPINGQLEYLWHSANNCALGSALVDESGQLVGLDMNHPSGLNTLTVSMSAKELEGVLNTKRDIDCDLKKRCIGAVVGWLDQNSRDQHQQRLGLPPNIQIPQNANGAIVYYTAVGSPSHEAGIQKGDIITHADGLPLSSLDDLFIPFERDFEVELNIFRPNATGGQQLRAGVRRRTRDYLLA
ncbi:probable periplasmic serine endoprotease DegP-like [Oppia nitens]|uniref:probable periplasmic serine endoprotease DegP-like n=1 Tax=Oppia nitens TaxID=1686743 RepID=UPI0023DBDE3F|nr:probable periplasmic serine endoprotease DegP-like [Oppia nitens]